MMINKLPKRGTITGLLFATSFFLIFQNTLFTSSVRRLSVDSGDSIDQLSELYKVVFDEDVSDEFADLQKQVRIRSECESYPDLETPPSGFSHTDHIDSHITTISCVPVHYRIPTSSVQGVENSMVFGILSAQQDRVKRDAIRQSWGKDETIFFIVSGDWTNVEEEYNSNLDILWVDQPEEYMASVSKKSPRKGALTFKSETFLVAMHDQVQQLNPNVEYFFKTDDDCYVNTKNLNDQIAAESKGKKLDYWGSCISNRKPYRYPKTRWYLSYRDYPFTYYPRYCVGAGYLLSPEMLECAVGEGHVEKVRYIRNEDAAIGLLAEKCGIESPPTSMDFELDMHNEHKDFDEGVAVQHNVAPEDMIKFHQIALSLSNGGADQEEVQRASPSKDESTEDELNKEEINEEKINEEEINEEEINEEEINEEEINEEETNEEETKEESPNSLIVTLIKKIW